MKSNGGKQSEPCGGHQSLVVGTKAECWVLESVVGVEAIGKAQQSLLPLPEYDLDYECYCS